MIKRIFAAIIVLSVLVFTAGCQEEIKNAVEKEQTPDFLNFDFSSTLVCTVSEVGNDQCIAEVTEANGTYDTETMVLINYKAVTDVPDMKPGDVITFSYDYAVDVSAVTKHEGKKDTYYNIPHIHVEELTLIPDYTPPETAPETTVE